MGKAKRPKPAPAAARAAPVTAAKNPPAAAAAASPPIVIEIPSSPDPSVGIGSKGSSNSNQKARKRPVPPLPLDFDDEIEMWTPRQKRRLDEDCQILSEDPLSTTTDVIPSPSAAANDEISVVAERGKVAIRDYPHARSACVKNPFSSTPHERHSDKCFCYVCDVAAPCVSWKGLGGHCHASDKDQRWKGLRLMMKKAAQVNAS